MRPYKEIYFEQLVGSFSLGMRLHGRTSIKRVSVAADPRSKSPEWNLTGYLSWLRLGW